MILKKKKINYNNDNKIIRPTQMMQIKLRISGTFGFHFKIVIIERKKKRYYVNILFTTVFFLF